MLGAITSLVVALGMITYPLPKDHDPREMALASDGAVWTTGDYSGLTRTDPAGATREFLKRSERDPTLTVESWFL